MKKIKKILYKIGLYKIKRAEQSIGLELDTWGYGKDFVYKDEKGYWHLYKNGIELTKGLKAKYAEHTYNGSWLYTDQQGTIHKFDKDNNKIIGISKLEKELNEKLDARDVIHRKYYWKTETLEINVIDLIRRVDKLERQMKEIKMKEFEIEELKMKELEK